MIDDPNVPAPTDSLTRLQDALSRAADGEFDEALAGLALAAPGLPAGLLQAARALVGDYRMLVTQSIFSTDEFLLAKRELHRKLDTIERQQAAIQKLSAPIIDVWEGVVTVPLTGDLDGAYAQELASRLLSHIERSRIAWVIVDLTGTSQLDTTLAGHLIGISQAIRLMGAQCLVTGIGPEAAQTLVTLGVSLSGLRPLSSLREALKHCLAQTAARPTAQRRPG
jgi:anti-anti-sigma regulatory factor